ncbi:MAG: NAD(P) transhydrogenase subunit alpha [Acidimicrobiales bacterium]
MINQPVTLLVIFVLAAFVGFEVISKVPSILHTPLMSGSNAIHGVILVGAMIIANEANGPLEVTLALIAVILATLNIAGGVAVTDRMLEMFKGRAPHPRGAPPPESPPRATPPAAAPASLAAEESTPPSPAHPAPAAEAAPAPPEPDPPTVTDPPAPDPPAGGPAAPEPEG